jgi:hypothetical protein
VEGPLKASDCALRAFTGAKNLAASIYWFQRSCQPSSLRGEVNRKHSFPRWREGAFSAIQPRSTFLVIRKSEGTCPRPSAFAGAGIFV